MPDPKIKGKGTTLTEILENRPGRNWTYNILTNEYVPPKGQITPQGRPSRRTRKQDNDRRGTFLNVDGEIVQVQGSGDIRNWLVMGEASKVATRLSEYLRKKGHSIAEVGRSMPTFSTAAEARGGRSELTRRR